MIVIVLKFCCLIWIYPEIQALKNSIDKNGGVKDQLSATSTSSTIPTNLNKPPTMLQHCISEIQEEEVEESICFNNNNFQKSVCTEQNLLENPPVPDNPKVNHNNGRRRKRDLAKHGYNFLMNMLPQPLRVPLHQSIQGTKHVRPQNSRLKEKISQLIQKRKLDQKRPLLLANQYSPSTLSNKRLTNVENQNYVNSWPWKQQQAMSNWAAQQQQQQQQQQFQAHQQQLQTQQYPYIQPNHQLLMNNPNNFLSSGNYQFHPQIISNRINNGASRNTEEATLLKKLKKLNSNNRLKANLEDQATDFMQKLVRNPNRIKRQLLNSTSEEIGMEESIESEEDDDEELQTRHRSNLPSNYETLPENLRTKRTIILSSNEIDVPSRYQIAEVSDEPLEETDDSDNDELVKQVQDEELEDQNDDERNEERTDFEEFESYSMEDLYGTQPYRIKNFLPLLPPPPPPPPLLPSLVNKHIVQKAVREELSNYHKKLEQEQKLKEILSKKQDRFNIVPRNPVSMILTAPMRALKHFHDFNKSGVNPVMTSLPKMVYATKKYFRDFGKNFHKNVLNLASDVVGDFDHIQPESVIEQMNESEGSERYRRDVNERVGKFATEKAEETTKFLTENEEETAKFSTEKDEEYQNNKTEIKEETEIEFSQKEIHFPEFTSNNWKTNGPILDYTTRKSSKDNAYHRHQQNIVEKLAGGHDFKLPACFHENYASIKTVSSRNDFEDRSLLDTELQLPCFQDNIRNKRYVLKIVTDDREVKRQVEDYLTQQLEDGSAVPDYLQPLNDYYDKINQFWTKIYSAVNTNTDGNTDEYDADEEYDNGDDLSSDEIVGKPKKKIQLKKIKPKVIFDNKGLPFMEYKGYKRPLILRDKRLKLFRKKTISTEKPPPPPPASRSNEDETESKIDFLISRAKDASETIGAAGTSVQYIPKDIVIDRVSSLLEEIDQLVHLNAEIYDEIFENLINIQHIKYSIEQDWKRSLIENHRHENDIHSQINLLSKFKDIQHAKDHTTRIIIDTLRKNEKTEFVRRHLIHSLVRLQKLQCLITSVVDDFEQNLKMKTILNTKKEIKYVDYLTELNFVNADTRNDLVNKLSKDRDKESQKNIEILNKLKKLMNRADDNDEFEHVAKIIWEMNNLKKLQSDTVKELYRKMKKNYKIKKELKILFDLQQRFEECQVDLNESLGTGSTGSGQQQGQEIKLTTNSGIKKNTRRKDIKELIAEARKKREEWLERMLKRRKL